MPPWIILTTLAAVTLVFTWGMFSLHESGALGRSMNYHDQFQRLIDDLEKLVGRANRLEETAAKVRDGVLLDHYHSAIKMIEALLEAVKKLSAYGDEADVLTAPIFLAKDIQNRLGRIEAAMGKGLLGKTHEFMKMAPAMAYAALGCHFCSRPFDARIFSKVRVKIDGRSEEVAACAICRQKLLTTRKARVLFFQEDGVQVHWSKAKSWTPSQEYWNINRDDLVGHTKSPHLELIYSSVSRMKSPNHNKDS